MLVITVVGIANPIVLRGRLAQKKFALGRILGPYFVDELSGSSVDLVEIPIGKKLVAVGAEGSGLDSLPILATNLEVDHPRHSQLSAYGYSLGCMVDKVFFGQLRLDKSKFPTDCLVLLDHCPSWGCGILPAVMSASALVL